MDKKLYDIKTNQICDISILDFETESVWFSVENKEKNISYKVNRKFKDVIFLKSTRIKDSSGNELLDGDIVVVTSPRIVDNQIYIVRQNFTGEWRIDNEIQGRSLDYALNIGLVEKISHILVQDNDFGNLFDYSSANLKKERREKHG